VDQTFKDAGNDPALALLKHGRPGREVIGQQPPGSPCPDNPPQGVEDIP